MNITNLLQQMLILLFFMAVGFVSNKTNIIDEDGNKKLSKLLLYTTQPAMILASSINSDMGLGAGDIVRITMYGCVLYAILIPLAFITSPLYRTDRGRKRVFRFMTIFGNVAFMGYPIVEALFGPDAVLLASIYCIPFNVLVYSAGIIMLSDGTESRIDWKLMLNPAMIATVAAVILVFINPKVPYVIEEAVDSLGSMTVPGAMIVIGASLGTIDFRSIFADKHVYILCFVKLIAAPIVVWAVCRLFVTDELYLGVLVVLAAMPVATITTMFTLEYGGDTATACRGVFMTTILSVITAPLVAYFLLS